VEGLLEAARYDRRIVVEKGLIDPREIEISILGNEKPIASIPGEVVPKDIFYTYNEKYVHGTAELLIPANLEEQQIQQIQSLAIKAYKITDCAGMARVDFLIDKYSGELYLNEINTIPGFTSISMYPKLWEASGIPYADLIERLIDLAIGRKSDRDKIERDFKA
jgi:D-alanine-D-alanine ligase